MALGNQPALTLLQQQPDEFLRKYPIYVMGNSPLQAPALQTGLADYAALGISNAMRPGRFLATYNMHATQSFVVAPSALLTQYGVNGAYGFTAAWLRMSEWASTADIYGITPLALPAVGGPDLMFTVMLTGCAIAVADTGAGGISIAHIRPTADMDGVAEDAKLDGAQTHAMLKKAGWTAVYGRGNYGVDRMVSVIGVRRNARWEVYAQKQALGTGPSDIRSVKRIFG